MSRTTEMALAVVGSILILASIAGFGLLRFVEAREEYRAGQAIFDGVEAASGQDAAIVKQYASLAQDFFKEPFEVVVFIYWPNLEGISFSTQHEKAINIPISQMCDDIVKAGIAIEDIGFCIHNHFTPIGFTPGDEDAYRYLKRRGFRGRFGIYYTALGRIRWMEDKR